MKIICLILALTSFGIMAKDIHPQAIELLGAKKAKKIVVQKKSVNKFIESVLAKRLPKKYKKDVVNIRKTIVSNANKYKLDPLFVLAMIDGESSFNPKAEGPVGEIGLMQLRESTAKWLSEEYLKKKWKGKSSLLNPYENIRLGTNYIRFLRSRYSKDLQYISAYNLGPESVKDAIERNVIPKDYKKHIMKRYLKFCKEK